MLESFQSLEGGLIGLFILFQLFMAVGLWQKIQLYKSMFWEDAYPTVVQKDVPIFILEQQEIDNVTSFQNEKLDEEELEDDTESITYLHPAESNGSALDIVLRYINTYLIKNRANGIDFHLISDIVNKHVENERSQIENRLPGPLYIGLAGTMLGIILGLSSVDFSASTLERVTSAGGDGLSSIEPLIKGVQVAMTASFFGLLITTVFSVFVFKKAQSDVEDGRSEFLSFLQAELMPRMSKGILPEVTTLSKKLDRFSRSTVKAISSLDAIVQTSVKSVEIEAQLLADIKKLDLDKMSHANIMLLNQLKGMMDSFKNFASYYNELNNSMSQTSTLVSRLNTLVENSGNLNIGLELMSQGVEDSRRATEFFNKHIQSFKEYDTAIVAAVSNTDSSMKGAVSELSKSVEDQASVFKSIVADYDLKLRSAFEESINIFVKNMKKVSADSLNAIQEGVPKFEQLDKLSQLEKLNEMQGLKESINRLTDSSENLHDSLMKNQKEQVVLLKNLSNISIPNSSSPVIIEKQSKGDSKNGKIIGNIDLVLKWTAYLTVIGIGIYSLLDLLNII